MDSIRKEYYEERLRRLIKVGRISVAFALLVIPYFIYQDSILLDLDIRIIFLRIAPVAAGVLFASISFFKDFKKLIIFLYALFQVSVLIMIFGLILLVMGTDFFSIAVEGAVIVIIFIGATSVGGIKYLLPVYLLPFCIYMIIFFSSNPDISEIVAVSNPAALIIGMLFLAEIIERNSYGQFISKELVKKANSELNIVNNEIRGKNELLEKELDLARGVHKKLLPETNPAPDLVKTAFIFKPVNDIGGDYFDFVQFRDDKKIGFFISDISGHGISSALMISMVKTLLVTAGDMKIRPGDLLTYINENMKEVGTDRFLTAFYGIYDSFSRTLKYARGGHEFPLLVSPDGTICELISSGKIIGSFSGIVFEEVEKEIKGGERLILFSDGLTDTYNYKTGAYYGDKFHDSIKKYRSLEPALFVEAIMDDLLSFNSSAAFEDDICLLCIDFPG